MFIIPFTKNRRSCGKDSRRHRDAHPRALVSQFRRAPRDVGEDEGPRKHIPDTEGAQLQDQAIGLPTTKKGRFPQSPTLRAGLAGTDCLYK